MSCAFQYLSFVFYVLSTLYIFKGNCEELLKEMKAECNTEGIKVQLIFQKPFYGVSYSFGHYDNERCRYIGQDSPYSGSTNYSFLIPSGDCGTAHNGATSTVSSTTTTNLNPYSESRTARISGEFKRKGPTHTSSSDDSNPNNSNEIYIENTLIIQHDPSIQEASDLAKKLRCVWQKEIHRPLVASLPFHNVNTRTEPSRFVGSPPHGTRERIGAVGTPTQTGRVRYESKGQIQSVPYYSFRKKWARSLDDENRKTNTSHEEELSAIPLPLTSSSAQTALPCRTIGAQLLCFMMLFAYF